MAGSVNKVILIGNLGRDPEIRTTQDGTKVANLSLATSENWRDKTSGERREKTEWHRVVVFNDRLVDVIEKYLKKGATIYIEGALQTRKWEKDGVERYSTEVVLQKFRGELQMLDSRGQGGEGGQVGYSGGGRGSDFGQSSPSEGYSRGGGAGGGSRGGGGGGTSRELDDEIPF